MSHDRKATAIRTAGLIVLILGAYALVGAIDRAAADRAEYQQWVHVACIPAHPGERVIAIHEGRRISCTIYSHAERGMVPRIVSAAVMDVPL
jgi:hypothetical protein